MFFKTYRISGSMILCRLDTIKWHVNKISRVWYSGNINSSPRSEENTCISMTYNVVPQLRQMVSADERQEFISCFPDIIRDLTEAYEDIPKVTERYATVLQYNVTNHKQASGAAVVGAYKMFESAENVTPENIRLANFLGWCVDLLRCSYQINDDIMDSSEVRRNMPSWYRNEGVGNQAINDAILIAHGPYLILKKYFSGHHCYIPSIEWLHEATIKTAIGKSLDMMNRLSGKPNLDAFTPNRYKALAKYKGTYPEYLLPIKLAMYLAGIYDAHLHLQVDNVLFELGDYFIAQNDILDCYGDPSITGKVGTDIQEGKCTWLVVTALQRATRSQREFLREHYGRPEPESELKIRNVYEELGVLNTFLKFEEDRFNAIYKHIRQMSKSLPEELLLKIVDTTYGRYRQHD